MKKLGLIIILFIIAISLVYFLDKPKKYIKIGNLYISEIVASNNNVIKDIDNDYSDYIELYNGNSYDINLKNYRLTDNLGDSKKYIFPDLIIKSGEYKIIYASKKNKCEDECHLNFKLNSEGETLTLIDPNGSVINRVTYPKLNKNSSYSFIDNDYKVVLPSPNVENLDIEIKKIDLEKYRIYINEYMSHNKGSVYASNGGYYDFIELYNDSDEDLNLLGLHLSDDEKNLSKYIFPEVIIKKKDYLVVYLTGGECSEKMICANFKLSDDDKKIILSYNDDIIDSVDIVKLDTNMSYGKASDRWLYYFTPTPGRENNTKGVERWDQDGNTENISS